MYSEVHAECSTLIGGTYGKATPGPAMLSKAEHPRKIFTEEVTPVNSNAADINRLGRIRKPDFVVLP
jgi:hypothetical protein